MSDSMIRDISKCLPNGLVADRWRPGAPPPGNAVLSDHVCNGDVWLNHDKLNRPQRKIHIVRSAPPVPFTISPLGLGPATRQSDYESRPPTSDVIADVAYNLGSIRDRLRGIASGVTDWNFHWSE